MRPATPAAADHAHPAAGVALHFDVGGRGRIVAHQDSGQNRRFAARALLEPFHAGQQFCFGLGCQGFTVQDECGHGLVILLLGCGRRLSSAGHAGGLAASAGRLLSHELP